MPISRKVRRPVRLNGSPAIFLASCASRPRKSGLQVLSRISNGSTASEWRDSTEAKSQAPKQFNHFGSWPSAFLRPTGVALGTQSARERLRHSVRSVRKSRRTPQRLDPTGELFANTMEEL